jgi:CRISPR system Cascade subunit CasE
MYMSKAVINDNSIIVKLKSFRYTSNAYYMHQLIRSLFPDSYEGSLLFRKTEECKKPAFYIVSKIRPNQSNSMSIDSKKYAPNLIKGQLLHFSLIANPAITVHVENRHNGVRYDVWMDTKKKGKEKGELAENIFLKCYENTKEWLIYRSNKFGFKVKNVDIERYVHHSFIKTKDKNKVSFGAVDYRGIIEVVDPDIFINKTLFTGMGPSKAFGCGLMLVKKA